MVNRRHDRHKTSYLVNELRSIIIHKLYGKKNQYEKEGRITNNLEKWDLLSLYLNQFNKTTYYNKYV